ncbi:E3 Ubiquitin ligase family protein [Striga asiatica]|uniref:RING-type E3 ubiquitin transferase n=1 Tax=Striga asiatica TaxID=4170 RepID=A0A5A7P635_STRAF|nr:E3 Ubiquitin ligase family protein [Striga asiatica]
MSIYDRATVAKLAHLATAADGAVLGVVVAYAAYRSIRKYTATSSALSKIRLAPAVQASDIRSVLADGDVSGGSDGVGASISRSGGEKLVVVRGAVEVKSAVEKGNWKSVRGSGLVVSRETGDQGVVLEQVRGCIYNELRGIFRWPYNIRSLFSQSWKQRESCSVRMVPFVLVEAGKRPQQSDYLVVNMEGSKHPLPLVTVFGELRPLDASPYTFLQALLGLQYPVGLIYEEKILHLGKVITAVGVCDLKDGIPEIKSCEDLPYFLSAMNKDEMVADLFFKSNVLMWSGLVFGSLAIGILGYCVARKWKKWKARRSRQQDDSAEILTDAEVAALDEESSEVPDGQLCVVCLTRIRRSAFVPCGHLVCCHRCALMVERESSPNCPLCRQQIRSTVRIYDI